MHPLKVDYTFQEILEHAKTTSKKVTSSCCSLHSDNPTASIIISDCKSENATVATFVAESTDGYLVTTTILKNTYGQLISDKHFGISTTGHLSIKNLFLTLPESIQHEMIAREWLARNPELLLDRVAKIFESSKSVIEKHESTISRTEEMLVNAHHNMKQKPKEMFTKAWLKWDVMQSLPWLKTCLEKNDKK